MTMKLLFGIGMPYSGIDDIDLPEHVKELATGEREVWVATFNSVYKECQDDKKTCEAEAFKIANAAIKNRAFWRGKIKNMRAIQDIPNLKEIPITYPTELCETCWFFKNSWCMKYETTVNWNMVCDSWTDQPDVIAAKRQDSMLAIMFENNQLLQEIVKAIQPRFTDVYVEWNDPATYHITLIYYPTDQALPEPALELDRFSIELKQLRLWYVGEKKWAIVLCVESPELRTLQNQLYQASYNIPMSAFSVPEQYQPHITLGYIDGEYQEDIWHEVDEISLPLLTEQTLIATNLVLTRADTVEYKNLFRIFDNEKVAEIVDLPLRSVSDSEEYVIYDFLGLPYVGPLKGNKDLHGTRFTPQTNIGSGLHSMPVHFDHGLSDIDALRGVEIGSAVLGEEVEDGRIISVYIKKRSKYEKMMAELQELGILRGSAQSIASLYQVDKDSGVLRSFVPCEFAVTVTPSNDENKVLQVRELMRSIITEDDFMAAKTALETTRTTANDVPVEASDVVREKVEDTTKAEMMEDEEKKDVSRTMQDVINEVERAVEVAPEVPTDAVLRSEVHELGELVRTLIEEVKVLRNDQLLFAEKMLRTLPTKIAAETRSLSASEVEVFAPRHNGVPTSGLRSPYGN